MNNREAHYYLEELQRMMTQHRGIFSEEFVCANGIAIQALEQERKRGKFIGTEYDGYADGNPVYYEWKCSECGCIFEDEEPTYNYCPNCGAEMEVDDNG